MALGDVVRASNVARTRTNKRWILWCEIQKKARALKRLEENEAAAWSCLGMFQGEMATYYCERDIDVMGDKILDLKGELRNLLAKYEAMGG